jgi:serine/threonine protein kinase
MLDIYVSSEMKLFFLFIILLRGRNQNCFLIFRVSVLLLSNYLTVAYLVVIYEVGFLARVSHPNTVKLLGYCQENANKELLIVYQFMEKGSLNYHLFGSKNTPLQH